LIQNIIEPLCHLYSAAIFPDSHWGKSMYDEGVTLDWFRQLYFLYSFMLKKAGYSVLYLYSAKSKFSDYLKVTDSKNSSCLVIPAFNSWLLENTKNIICLKKYEINKHGVPNTFVGTVLEIEALIDSLLTEQARKEKYPHGFKWVEGTIQFRHYEFQAMENEVDHPSAYCESECKEMYNGILETHSRF